MHAQSDLSAQKNCTNFHYQLRMILVMFVIYNLDYFGGIGDAANDEPSSLDYIFNYYIFNYHFYYIHYMHYYIHYLVYYCT